MDNSSNPPKRLIACSVLVILIGLCWLSFGLGALLAPPNPFAGFGSFLVVPLGAATAVQQYRGTFRAVASAASSTAILLYLFGGMLMMATVSGMFQIAADLTIPDMQLLILIGTLLAIGVGLISMARLNQTWSRRLQNRVLFPDGASRKGVSLRELLGLTSAVALVAAMTAWSARDNSPRTVEHVAASEAPMHLPADATDVSYSVMPTVSIACEFTTSEQAFRAWVDSGIGSLESNSSGVQLVEITEPVTFHRIRSDVGPSDADPAKSRVTIRRGLHYRWSEEDRGVYAVFDREMNRGYFHSHSR